MGTGIFLDYEKGILLVNGEKTNCPVRVVLKTGDGRDMAKLMNYENLTPESADSVTEVTVCSWIAGCIKIRIPHRDKKSVRDEH